MLWGHFLGCCLSATSQYFLAPQVPFQSSCQTALAFIAHILLPLTVLTTRPSCRNRSRRKKSHTGLFYSHGTSFPPIRAEGSYTSLKDEAAMALHRGWDAGEAKYETVTPSWALGIPFPSLGARTQWLPLALSPSTPTKSSLSSCLMPIVLYKINTA